jgi:hypothetical protein
MSVDQIEEQIRGLTPGDLGRLTEWFGQFLAERVSASSADWQESAEQIAELDRRLAEFKADPAIATHFETGYFDDLKRRLADERAQKASARQV